MKISFNLLFMFLISCNIVTETKNLGLGYYFDTDSIILSTQVEYDGVGLVVVPPKILKYNFDERFVIAKSLNNNNEEIFWIIDKTMAKNEIEYSNQQNSTNSYYIYSNIHGPLNYNQFLNIKQQHKIDLEF